MQAITAAAQSIDPRQIATLRVRSLDGSVQFQKVQSQMFALLAAILAGLAIMLAAIGIHGVVSFAVKQRTREIGIRISLGAPSSAVWRTIVLQALRPVFAGLVLGLGLSAALSALLHQTLVFPGSIDFLYGVPFYDPATFAGLIGFVLLVAMAATASPALRAMHVDPALKLRYE
jgi:putative ABC transport system permease protein